MKRSDVVRVAEAALATAILMLVMFWPSNISAVIDGQERKAEIAIPKLLIDGIQFTLTFQGGRTYTADQEPVFELKADNVGCVPAESPVQILMVSRTAPSPFARMVPVWRPIWQERCSLRLDPGETKSIVLKTNVSLPANSQFNVLLQTPGAIEDSLMIPTGISRAGSIVALSFSTAVPQIGPAALPGK
jgi:hypothetical protein